MNVLSKKGGRNSLVPHSLDANTVRDSMQYYRVWIYSCNWILGITSALFTIFAAFVFLDVRMSFLRGVELYHPTFIYAYTALLIQCGVMQIIGYIGAHKLSHKLLSIYWIILLLLTIGDVVVGLVWVFKLENVKISLRPILTREFIDKYTTDADFTENWNRVQTQEHCCGVNGPLDFDKFSPEVRMQILQEQNVGRSKASLYLSLPESCCTNIEPLPTPTSDYAFGPFSLSRPPDNRERLVVRPLAISMAPTTHPNSLALLSSNFSAEQHQQSSEEYESLPIPGPLGHNQQRQQQVNPRRHVVHRKKIPQGPNGTLTDSNNSLPFGETSTEEPLLEVSEISVPFTCRNPEIHAHTTTVPAAVPQPQSVYRRKNINPLDDNGNIDSRTTMATEKSIDVSSTPGSSSNLNSGPSSDSSRKSGVSKRHASIPQFPTAPARKARVRIYRNGCGLKLVQWLDHISGILFILGFCIIGFIKACFLIILRYEIREMIEKIHTMDQNEDLNGFVTSSPSRLALLQKQSSLSSGQCHFTGVTIKSPQGDGGPKCFHERNSFVSSGSMSIDGVRHHHGCCAKSRDRDRTGMRRPSGRSLCECDRHSSHSQETVNMTLLITSQQQQQHIGGYKSSGDESGGEGARSEPISLIVPKPEERELRRSRFANYGAWDSNVSGESSTSTGGGDFGMMMTPHMSQQRGKTEVVQVEMENLSSIQFVDESDTSLAPVDEELNLMTTRTSAMRKSISKENVCEGETMALLPMPGPLATRRRNGNNNSVDSSDSVMALIGTAV